MWLIAMPAIAVLGFAVELMAQPVWLAATWSARKWGVLVNTLIYTNELMTGLFNHSDVLPRPTSVLPGRTVQGVVSMRKMPRRPTVLPHARACVRTRTRSRARVRLLGRVGRTVGRQERGKDVAISFETERVMTNWARWRTGALVGLSVSGAYQLEAKGPRAETPIPIINGEAVEVDQAVQSLDAPLKGAVEEYWLRSGPVVDMARRLGCGVTTLYRRLERAHQAVELFRHQLRARTLRMREAFLRPARHDGDVGDQGGGRKSLIARSGPRS